MATLKDSAGNPIDFEEGESADLIVVFEDMASTPTQVPLASLITVTFTLFVKETKKIINSRNAQDVKNTNDGTIASGGTLTMRLGPSDNAIKGKSSRETHVARFTWTWNDGVAVRTGKSMLYEFDVFNHPDLLS